MANTFSSSALLNARVWQLENMQKAFDQRNTITQIYRAFEDGQRYIVGLDNNLTTQTKQIMYLINKDYTVNTSKSCTPTGEVGGSNIVSLTWAQLGAAVKINQKQMDGNELNATKALANALYQAESSIFYGASGLDAVMLAYLEANRTYVNKLSAGTSGSSNTWRGAANYDVTVPHANEARFWGDMQADMMINEYSGKLWDIGNTWFASKMNYYGAQGAANSTNTAYQFSNMPAGIEWCPSNLVTATGYFNSKHYIVPEGGVASLYANEPLNIRGEESEAGKWYTIESMLRPGIFFDVFEKNSCADTTDDGGRTQDSVKTLELTLNYSLTKQPISTSNETPIFKYQIYTA